MELYFDPNNHNDILDQPRIDTDCFSLPNNNSTTTSDSHCVYYISKLNIWGDTKLRNYVYSYKNVQFRTADINWGDIVTVLLDVPIMDPFRQMGRCQTVSLQDPFPETPKSLTQDIPTQAADIALPVGLGFETEIGPSWWFGLQKTAD